MIAQEEDQGVVSLAAFFQLIEDCSNYLIGTSDGLKIGCQFGSDFGKIWKEAGHRNLFWIDLSWERDLFEGIALRPGKGTVRVGRVGHDKEWFVGVIGFFD